MFFILQTENPFVISIYLFNKKYTIQSIKMLINCFTRLPGVGYKTAERYAYRIIETDKAFVLEFCDALKCVKESVRLCEVCG